MHCFDDLKTSDYSSVFANVDAVIHLAALVHQPKINEVSEYRLVNTDSTLKLAKASLEQGVIEFVL